MRKNNIYIYPLESGTMKRRLIFIASMLLAVAMTAGAQGRGPARPAAPQDTKETEEK